MRSQNIKCKSSSFGRVGGISCLLLLLLTFLAVNPIISLSVFAVESDEEGDGSGEINPDGVSSDGSYDNQIMTTAITPSTITISFSPSSASGQVTPIDVINGDKARVDVQATVNVKNSGGYSVYVGSNSSDLENGPNKIPSVDEATTYANLPLNSWGYSWKKVDSATDKTVTDSYIAMPATLRSAPIYSSDSLSITDETKYFMLSFAARIGSNMPAGTYSNSVTMSVISSPLEVTVTWADIATMQEMTNEICSSATSGASKQLKDVRDGKYYWVSKLADGKCWMTQNLDLDLTSGTKLTSDTSDVPAAGYTPNYTTATTASSSTTNTSTVGQNSWSLGNYRITKPDTSSDCGSKKNSAANCASQFTAHTTPTTANNDTNAHYILGNHYQWNAATAGTGGSITSGTATNSICPRNWRLPTSNTGGEFEMLVTALGGASSTNNITRTPFYGVRGGYVSQNANLFYDAGAIGYYWSSTPNPTNTNAYSFSFGGTDYVDLSLSTNRSNGFSIRCVAR